MRCFNLRAGAPSLLLLLGCLALPLGGPVWGAGLLVATGPEGGALDIVSHDVRVMINNGVVVTEVDQVFKNKENRQVEALYTFPVPRGASVANFSMWINGQEMVGEVVEKQRAREIYESYKRVKRDPGLLEQVDYKRFEMRIFPIAGQAEQRVRIVYYQELEYDHDSAAYIYPLATTAGAGNSKTTGRFSFSIEAKSETPIVSLTSPSHPDSLAIAKRDGNRYVHASLETREGNLNRDVVIHYQVARPQTGVDLVVSKQPGDDGYLLLTLTGGQELDEKMGGADYVFVLDISGSMAQGGKLGLSHKAVEAFIATLGEKDRLEIITINVEANSLFRKLARAGEEARKSVKEFLSAQRALGGTQLRPAMQAAYRYHDLDRPLNVVILSDGMTEVHEQAELLQLIQARPQGTSVFCVGVGNDVNRPLLTQLAEGAGGLAAFLSTDDDFARQADSFRRKLIRPAATEVEIAFEGIEVYDREPKTMPNLFYGQPVRMYARYRGAGPAKITWKANVLGRAVSQVVAVEVPQEERSNSQIERMWASHRVERLMGELRAGASPSLLPQIIQLCEGYSIAGEYASFIVLENNEEYRRWSIERRNAVRFGRDQQNLDSLRRKFDALSNQASDQAGPLGPNDAVASKSTSSTPADSSQAVNPPSATVPQSNARDPRFSVPAPQPQRDEEPTARSTPGIGGGGGGGALDPISVAAAAALAAAGWSAYRRMQEGGDQV